MTDTYRLNIQIYLAPFKIQRASYTPYSYPVKQMFQKKAYATHGLWNTTKSIFKEIVFEFLGNCALWVY